MTPGSALVCLALNIYHEARGEPHSGQLAVAMVTMNRAEWEPANVCAVVYQRGQFSWTHTKRDHAPRNAQAWRKAQKTAKAVIEGKHVDRTRGATHFHARRVQPSWSKSLERTVRIGNHIFYVQESRSRPF